VSYNHFDLPFLQAFSTADYFERLLPNQNYLEAADIIHLPDCIQLFYFMKIANHYLFKCSASLCFPHLQLVLFSENLAYHSKFCFY